MPLEPRRRGVGAAVRIATGARLPAGADRVIRDEEISWDGPLLTCIDPGRNDVRPAGSAWPAGAVLALAGTAVDAPGEAPSRPAMLPSAADSTVVPNSSTPPAPLRRITWTRCPAVTSSQSDMSAAGMYSSSASKRLWVVAASCEPR